MKTKPKTIHLYEKNYKALLDAVWNRAKKEGRSLSGMAAVLITRGLRVKK